MMIAGLTLYEICWYFIAYAFIGWVVEVIFHAVAHGDVINRGFLNGPVCPIYGVGMLGVIVFMNSITPGYDKGYPLGILFVGGMFFTTCVELGGGWLLDKLFHTKWWDYSDKPFNFRGYICLQFSIIWGLGVVLVMDVLHPLVSSNTAGRVPAKYGWPLLAICYFVFLADMVLTLIVLHDFNRKLAELEQLSGKIRSVSDSLTNVIAGKSISAVQKLESKQVQAALGKAELQKKMDEISASMLKEKLFGFTRILKAFPNMVSTKYSHSMSFLKEKLTINSEKKL